MANEPLLNKDAVLEAMVENRAISALRSAGPELIAEAKFDRGELTLRIAAENLRAACEIVKAAGYNFFEDVTCVDWYPAEPRFQVTYHILSHALKERIRFHVLLESTDPSVDSITSIWPSANYYEREVWDLFGVRFHGHPDLRRIMMPEEWKGHPLQKTYPVEGYR